jgi:hypothetical protein
MSVEKQTEFVAMMSALGESELEPPGKYDCNFFFSPHLI